METIQKLKDHWLYKRVISISNSFKTEDDNSLHAGEVVDIIPITQSNCPTLVVKFDGMSDPVVCFSTIIEFKQELYNALLKLTPQERWMLIQAFATRFNPRI